MSEAKKAAEPPSLEAVRQRIDALDAELLRLVDERASLARVVAAAKEASGDGGCCAASAGDGDSLVCMAVIAALLLRRVVVGCLA